MFTTPLETAFLPVLCTCYDASPFSPQTPPPGPGLYATPGLHLNNFPALQHLNNFPSLRLMTDQCHWWLYTAMGAKCLKNTYRKNIQKNRECHLWLIFHLFCTYMAPTFCIRCVLFLHSFEFSGLPAFAYADPSAWSCHLYLIPTTHSPPILPKCLLLNEVLAHNFFQAELVFLLAFTIIIFLNFIYLEVWFWNNSLRWEQSWAFSHCCCFCLEIVESLGLSPEHNRCLINIY